MSWTTTPDRAIGYALAEADWDGLKDNLNTGTWVVLGSTSLSVAAASIDFQSISGTFAHLRVVAYLRSTDATNAAVAIRLNNDSGANYDRQSLTAVSGTTPTASETFAATSIATFRTFPGSSAPAGLYAGFEFFIPHYANASNNKAVVGSLAAKIGTSTGNAAPDRIAGFWRSNSAVNRVTLFSNGGGNLSAGSQATLLGLP